MDEQKNIALAILGIVAVMAIIGLVLLFKGGATGQAVGGYDIQSKRFSTLADYDPTMQVSCQDCYTLYGWGTQENANCLKMCYVGVTDQRRFPGYTSAWENYRPYELPGY